MAGTLSEILSRFKKDVKNSFQAQKNIVDVTEKYIGLLENADIGGGSSITYSTTEQIIGKWTDDKDLYQLTVIADGADNTGYQNILELPVATYNIKEINYVFESTTSGEVINGPWVNSNMWMCAIAVSSSKRYLMIKRQTSDAGWKTVKLICTIRYTKNS